MDKLFITLQYLVPQHLLSRLVGFLARTELSWVKNPLITTFIRQFDVDMSEAANPDPRSYASFNQFFTRPLQPGARAIDPAANAIVSPADGAISQLGDISHGRIMQAKGQTYSALELLGGDADLAAEFTDGKFATIYLSPKDYHRVHMPLDGTLRQMVYVPGDLFSVNQTTAANVPRLFARNERLVAIFDTSSGPMAMVLVGAMIVAAIETVWAGQITPPTRQLRRTHYGEHTAIKLAKGDEMGRFKLGSTVVLLFPRDSMQWQPDLSANSALRMGQLLGTLGP